MQSGRPSWLRDADEYPRKAEATPLWCENYMTYLYDPVAEVGVCFHLCHRSDHPNLWEEVFVVSLPGDRQLVAKAFAVGREERGVSVCGVSFECEEPYAKWVTRFRGGARLVSGGELRAGPLTDGLHIPVDLELVCTAFGPPYDFGAPKLETDWGHGHYEQAMSISGHLSFGGKTVQLRGEGHRDHSWGARDYRTVGGRTTWMHGHFPSGRWFGFLNVPGLPSGKPFAHAVTGDAQQANVVQVTGYTLATTPDQALEDFELKVSGADGISTIRAQVLSNWGWHFTSDLPGGVIAQSLERPGATELCLGRHAPPVASHSVFETYVRYDWDGEIGYGLTERTVFLL